MTRLGYPSLIQLTFGRRVVCGSTILPHTAGTGLRRAGPFLPSGVVAMRTFGSLPWIRQD